ncbi:hypothetical protein MKW92_043887 [Papaver armeniacum]|nr:hypothetical protein MKW92_043887 [Papaver armeniacum]
MVARAKNPVHSVSFPILVFRDTSVVHIGAIAVSFLFVVMMFHIQIAEIHEEVLRYLPVSDIIGLILWWEMLFTLDNETIPLLPTRIYYEIYGLCRKFLVPSLILLVAMIGAIVLTMHRTTKVIRQDDQKNDPRIIS